MEVTEYVLEGRWNTVVGWSVVEEETCHCVVGEWHGCPIQILVCQPSPNADRGSTTFKLLIRVIKFIKI